MKIVFVGNGPSTVLEKRHISQIKSIDKSIEITTNTKEVAEAEVLLNPALDELDYKNLPNLKWIHVQSAGINKMPLALRNSEILLTNSSGVHPIPISEMVFCYLLMWSRGVFQTYRNQILKKEWMRGFGMFRMGELYGKTIIIAGMGKIGSRIALLSQAFGMKVIGVVRDPKRKEENADKLISLQELDKYLSVSDFVIDCLPATEETKGVFNLKRFKKFKKGGFFVNIGRGTTVVEKDLVKALKEGPVAGAGLDVFESEPLSKSSPLWKMENVIITPHISGWTPYYTDRVVDIFCENLKAYLQGKPMPNLVDKELGY